MVSICLILYKKKPTIRIYKLNNSTVITQLHFLIDCTMVKQWKLLIVIVDVLTTSTIISAFGIDVNLNLDADVLTPSDLKFVFHKNGIPIQEMLINVELGSKIRKVSASDGIEFVGTKNFIKFQQISADAENKIIKVSRRLPRGTTSMDCINLNEGKVHWFGGPQQKYQYWPVEKLQFRDYSYITKEADNCGVAERYWVNTNGMFFFVDDVTPLFIDQRNERPGHMCFKAKLELPYDTHSEFFMFSYNIGFANDARAAHMLAIENFLGKPTGIPDELMVRHPIWSTWAKYKRDIDTTTVLEFAQQIVDNKFQNSQFEIDDDWEVCYGAQEFNLKKFPNIKGLTKQLNDMGFRTTLWIHPFINKHCEPYYSNAKKNKLVSDCI